MPTPVLELVGVRASGQFLDIELPVAEILQRYNPNDIHCGRQWFLKLADLTAVLVNG